jgi:tetratricopeptide (TPR) repeat protein
MLGTRAAGTKNWDEAIKYLTASAEKAELWGDTTAKQKANQILAKVYQVQGGEAFNAGNYEAAVAVFEKGYAANKRNTEMALNLAESYFRSDMYQDGMKICTKIAAMNADKFAEAIAEAQAKMDMYTNNEVAKLQMANDYDGIIAMAAELEDAAMAAKITMQAYYGKKEFAKMVEVSAAALEAQTTDEGRSDIYYLLGVAYNEMGQFEQAIATMKNVTAGNNVANAAAVIEALTAQQK